MRKDTQLLLAFLNRDISLGSACKGRMHVQGPRLYYHSHIIAQWADDQLIINASMYSPYNYRHQVRLKEMAFNTNHVLAYNVPRGADDLKEYI